MTTDGILGARCKECDTLNAMTSVSTCTSAFDIGRWVAHEINRENPDTVHITRVVTQEVSRWFNGDQRAVADLAREPVSSGSPQWDAFLEGVVSYLMQTHNMEPPAWVTRTVLDDGWAPNGHVYSTDWNLVNVLSTPTILLNKGVVFARRNFSRL